ncbi:MAG TPA: phage holin family protein, partial [Streptosporangiaceae bacterium]|nr:phage holin family protein [Streptosporangiaceae bacterium]
AVVGLFVGCLLVVLLCFAFAYGLVALHIWEWAAFLIVAGTCLLLIGVAGLIAFGRIRKVTGMKMTRKTVMDDIGLLRRGEPGPNGSGTPQVTAGTRAAAEIPPARSLPPEACRQSRSSRSAVPGRTARSPRTVPGFTWRAWGTAPWCCCCTVSPSSGGPGATS